MAKKRKCITYLTSEELLRYGGSLTMTDQERLLVFIGINKEVTQSDVYRLFNGRVSAKTLHCWLKQLYDRGLLSMRSVPSNGGRPVIIWTNTIVEEESPSDRAKRRKRKLDAIRQDDFFPALPPHPFAEEHWAELLRPCSDDVRKQFITVLKYLGLDESKIKFQQVDGGVPA